MCKQQESQGYDWKNYIKVLSISRFFDFISSFIMKTRPKKNGMEESEKINESFYSLREFYLYFKNHLGLLVYEKTTFGEANEFCIF